MWSVSSLTMPTCSHAFQLCLSQLIDVRMTNRTVIFHSIQCERIVQALYPVWKKKLPFGIFTRAANHKSSCTTNNDAIILRCHFDNHSRIAVLIGMLHLNSQDHHTQFEADSTQKRMLRSRRRWSERRHLQSDFCERFPMECSWEFFQVHFHCCTSMVQLSPWPQLILVRKQSGQTPSDASSSKRQHSICEWLTRSSCASPCL